MTEIKQTIVITGGGSGIGLAIAKKFMEQGNTVIITGRNLSKLEKVKEKLPSLYITQSDVTNEEDVKALVIKMQVEHNGIDVLINNAGIMNLVDTGDEHNDLKRQFNEIEINFHAPIRMVHYFLPQLKKSRRATIINVSSGLAYVPFSQAPVYSAAKSALHCWTQAIRAQLKSHNIRVIELLPPVVDTQLAHNADLRDENLTPMPAEKLAEIFWKDYANGKDEITPGLSKQLKLMSRVAPKFIFNQLNKQPIPKKHD